MQTDQTAIDAMGILDVAFADRSWRLIGGGGLFWPRHGVLMIADLHLGKDATFRAASIGVPRGSTAATLDRVSAMVAATESRELMILGDLFHARSSLTTETCEQWESFLARHHDVDVTLIRGNHDSSVGPLPPHWPISVVESSLHLDGIALSHFPGPCPDGADVLIAGHTHPADVIRVGGESTGKMPCFWLHRRCLTLPACGHFTGTAKINRTPGDRVWLIADGQVIPHPKTPTPPSTHR